MVEAAKNLLAHLDDNAVDWLQAFEKYLDAEGEREIAQRTEEGK